MAKAVIAFKIEPVRQFYEMRSLIIELQSFVWKDTRQLGKQIRKEETDSIKNSACRYFFGRLSAVADRAVRI